MGTVGICAGGNMNAESAGIFRPLLPFTARSLQLSPYHTGDKTAPPTETW
jgi:hypothetical protein